MNKTSRFRIAAILLLALLSLLPLRLLALPYSNLDWIIYDPAYQGAVSYPGPTPVAQPQPSPTPAPSPEAAAPPCAEVPLPGEPLAATVDGQAVGSAALEREVSQYLQALEASGTDLGSPEAQAALPEIRSQVLELLIEDVLVQQIAVEMGLGVPQEVLDERIAQEVAGSGGLEPFQAWLEETGQTREEFQRAICQELLRAELNARVTAEISGTMEMVNARVIVVAEKEQAVAVLARLASGEEFGQVAAAVSIDPTTRALGGEMGWFPRGLGIASPQVEAAAFAGRQGEVQGPIPLDEGYAIVQTVEPPGEQMLTPETREALRARALESWLASRRQAAEVVILVDQSSNPGQDSSGQPCSAGC